MEQKPVQLSVKINSKELYSFLLWHTYTTASGLFGLFISVMSLVLLAMGYANGDSFRALALIVLGLMFTVINPILLYKKARNQAVNNPVYKNEMIYILDEKGITLKAGEAEETVEWTRIRKCRKTKVVYILYTTKIHAILLPFSAMKEEKELVEQWIHTKVRGR